MMTRVLWPICVLLICLPVAILATGVSVPFIHRPAEVARPLPVPDGDQELAWFHTTTNGTTWERFVAGIVRSQELVPGVKVDDSAAFLDQTTAAPEVVISKDGRNGKLRIRWYKLSNEATSTHWIQALSKRNPPPLAVIGGGSSDRAVDLANALVRQENWKGERPLLLLTTATADEVTPELQDPNISHNQVQPTINLVDVYKGNSFRFCFTNRQMADAVLDFVWVTPGLRPETFSSLALAAACSGAAVFPNNNLRQPSEVPHVFSIFWQDDPYSTDLHEQFKLAISQRFNSKRVASKTNNESPNVHFATWSVPFSIGGFSRPNQAEFQASESILDEFRRLPPQRSLLVVPTVTQPARRLLRTLAESSPTLSQRFVAVTGDGIPINAIYRDGEFAWPLNTIRVPLVSFMHNNPVGWELLLENPNANNNTTLRPPNSTEDVLHFAELARVVVEAAFPADSSTQTNPNENGLVQQAHVFAEKLRQSKLREQKQNFFDPSGNRLGGTGEYVVAVLPSSQESVNGKANGATMEIWKRGPGGRWLLVQALEVNQRHVRSQGIEDLGDFHHKKAARPANRVPGG